MFVCLTEELNPYQKEITKRSSSSNIEYQVANDPSFRPIFPSKRQKSDELQLSIIPLYLKELCESCWDHEERHDQIISNK